jgi:arginine exporter protein ArgO
LNNTESLKVIITYAGCAVVIVYGFRIMKMKMDYEVFETQEAEIVHRAAVKAEEFVHKHGVPMKKDTNFFGMFVMGIMMCLSSITLPASWFAIIGYIKSFKVIDNSLLGGLLFAAGAFIGTALWFITLLKLISGNKHRINRETVGKLNIIAGIILLTLGVILFIKATGSILNIF